MCLKILQDLHCKKNRNKNYSTIQREVENEENRGKIKKIKKIKGLIYSS